MRRVKALFLSDNASMANVDHKSAVIASKIVIILIIANLFAAGLLYLVYLVF